MRNDTNTHQAMTDATESAQRSLIDQFGFRVRDQLDQAADALPDRTLQRLAAGRALAMAKHNNRSHAVVLQQSLVTDHGAGFGSESRMRQQLMFLGTAVLLALGLFALAQWHQTQSLAENADIDQAILSDDLPFTAHLDPLYPEMLRREQ